MVKLHMLKSVTDTINTSLIFQNDNVLVVFDGGMKSDAEYLYSYLKELGGKVDGWFFTHIHFDHVWAFCELMTKHGDEIQVKNIYYNFPSDDFLREYEPAFQYAIATMELKDLLETTIAKYQIPVVTVQRNDKFSFGGIEVEVLRVPDETITENAINNASICCRVEAEGKSIMILGDLGVEGGEQLLKTVDPELLSCDYVQMAHHGQNGVGREVYEAIQPKCCLWCTPSWLWENVHAGETGYDKANFKTIITRGWMSEMGVRQHYVMKDGTQIIDL